MALLIVSQSHPAADVWAPELRRLVPGLDIRYWPDLGDPADIAAVLMWQAPEGMFARLPALKAIFATGAGVDAILRDPAVPVQLPLARLIDPTLSYGLPRNLLAGKRGLNTGFATVQCSMSALVMENRTLSSPGSVDSIPGKSNAEDHVSNSTWCGRKARTIVENVEMIIAAEILLACQALSLIAETAKDHPLGKGTQAALDALRETIPPALDGDRWYAAEMNQATALIRSGAIVEAVEAAVGGLE